MPPKVVGCRGGNQNVEGCWGAPYLKIKKGFLVFLVFLLVSKMFYVFKRYLVHITKGPFHVFDRYDIHIQAFGDFMYANFIILRSSSSQVYIKLYIFIYSPKKTVHVTFTKSKIQKIQILRYGI